jgi:ribose 5-phosphate isomerase B
MNAARPLRIAIATDHAAVHERLAVAAHLKDEGHEVHDLGCAAGKPCDYPDQAALVAREVAEGRADYGILICGTGIGVAMAAGKIHGIRAATIGNDYSSEMTRRHNDANVACFGARIHSAAAMMRMVDIFLTTPFDGGRHAARVEKIMALENAPQNPVS